MVRPLLLKESTQPNEVRGIEEILNQAYQLINLEDDEQEKQNIRKYFGSQKARIVQDIEVALSLCHPDAQILDVGCYPFFTTIALQKLGYKVVGADLEPERLFKIISHAGIDVRKCNIETEPFPFVNDKFDLIIFCEVFEHLRINLISTMEEIHRVLKPGGVLLLSTPNFLSFKKIWRLLQGKTGNIFDAYNSLKTRGHAGHIREYTVRDVKEFTQTMGFTCKQTIYVGKENWQFQPKPFFQALSHRLFPASRNCFMLVLVKK